MCETHPACLSSEKLIALCEVRRQRRSGPGGQHRNKVETAIVLVHRPTGLRSEASERRSQAENRQQAIWRLRVRLAIEVRSSHEKQSPPLSNSTLPSPLWLARCAEGRIRVNRKHEAYPCLLAEALDACQWADYEVGAAAERLQVSMSQLLRFLRREPTAWAMLNLCRRQRGLRALH